MTRLIRWAVAAFYVLLATSAVSGTIRGSEQNCMYLANSTVMVLMTKEANPSMTWAVAESQLKQVLKEAIGDPNSYIADEDDAILALRAFKAVWHGTDPAAIYDSCIRAKPARG